MAGGPHGIPQPQSQQLIGPPPQQQPLGVSAHLIARDAQVIEHIESSTLTLANQSQQDVVRVYIGVATAARLVASQIDHSLGSGRGVDGCVVSLRFALSGAEPLNQVLYVTRLQTHLAQYATGDPISFSYKS